MHQRRQAASLLVSSIGKQHQNVRPASVQPQLRLGQRRAERHLLRQRRSRGLDGGWRVVGLQRRPNEFVARRYFGFRYLGFGVRLNGPPPPLLPILASSPYPPLVSILRFTIHSLFA